MEIPGGFHGYCRESGGVCILVDKVKENYKSDETEEFLVIHLKQCMGMIHPYSGLQMLSM